MTKRIDPALLAPVVGTLYPSPFDAPCRARQRRKLGDAAGLTQFGINLLTLPPGAWSSQRHWHTESDEFIYVLSGEVNLVTDAGEELLRGGDAAGFKAGDRNGHCLQNRSNADVQVLEMVRASLMTRRTILASTWLVRPAASRRSIPIATALHTKTSGAAPPIHSPGRSPAPSESSA